MNRRIFIIIGLSVILIVVTLLFLQDLVREVVIVPLSYAIWYGKLIYESFDQEAIWVSFLIIFVVIAILSMNISRKRTISTDHFRGTSAKGVHLWRERLQDTKRGEYLKWRLAQRLSVMIIEAQAYRYGLTTAQIEEMLNNGTLEIPDAIRAYLRASQNPPSFTGKIASYFFSTEEYPLDLDPEKIADFLENDLEIVS